MLQMTTSMPEREKVYFVCLKITKSSISSLIEDIGATEHTDDYEGIRIQYATNETWRDCISTWE